MSGVDLAQVSLFLVADKGFYFNGTGISRIPPKGLEPKCALGTLPCCCCCCCRRRSCRRRCPAVSLSAS